MRVSVAFFLTILSTYGSLSAQKQWVVDILNRPGTDFVDFPPALQAAADGDRIVLRSYPVTGGGRYTGADIAKAVTLIGEGSEPIRLDKGQAGCTISNISFGKVFRMSHVTIIAVAGFSNCPGQVHLDSVGRQFGGSALDFTSCASVTITNSSMEGYGNISAMACMASNVTATSCTFTGAPVDSLANPGSPAIVSTASSLTLNQCVATGGTLLLGWPLQPWPAILAQSSNLRISGVAGPRYESRYDAGTGSIVTIHAIDTTGGSVILDPRTLVRDSNRTPESVWGTAQVALVQQPFLTCASALRGASFTLTLNGQAGDGFGTMVALPAPPLSTPWGDWWLDANTLAILDLGTLGVLGTRALTIPVPATAAIAGLPLAFQTFAGQGNTAILTPAVVTVIQ